jgi:arginine decarboxylase
LEEYGTPLKFTYLPQISNNINKAKIGFVNRWKKINMRQNIITAIVQSSHFEFIMNEAKNNIHIETLQLSILILLKIGGKINKSTYVICNGFKGTNTLKIFHV